MIIAFGVLKRRERRRMLLATQDAHGLYARFFNGMLTRGHYFPPSGYEAIFVSLAHTDDDIDATLRAARNVALDLADAGPRY